MAKKITTIAIFSVLAYLSTLVFKIPISFLSYDLKDVIIAIAGFLLGAIPIILISFIVSILEMITISNAGIIGFFMNFIASIFYILPIVFFKNKNKSLLVCILIGTISMSIIMFLFNILITPIYMNISLNDTIVLLFTTITPFNIIKGLLNGFIISILYKPLLKALKKSSVFKY